MSYHMKILAINRLGHYVASQDRNNNIRQRCDSKTCASSIRTLVNCALVVHVDSQKHIMLFAKLMKF